MISNWPFVEGILFTVVPVKFCLDFAEISFGTYGEHPHAHVALVYVLRAARNTLQLSERSLSPHFKSHAFWISVSKAIFLDFTHGFVMSRRFQTVRVPEKYLSEGGGSLASRYGME